MGDTPDQKVQILVEGDGNVDGVFIEAKLHLGRTGEVPAITGMDLISPSLLFGPNHTEQNDFPGTDFGHAGYWGASTTTQSGTVTPGAGMAVLAEVTIDTTGFGPGTYNLYINKKLDDNGEMVEIRTLFPDWDDATDQEGNLINTLNAYNGTITLKAVPEPASLALWAGFLAMGAGAAAEEVTDDWTQLNDI